MSSLLSKQRNVSSLSSFFMMQVFFTFTLLVVMCLDRSLSMECFVGSQAIIKRASVNESSGNIIETSVMQTETQLKIEQCEDETCACCSYFYNVSESRYCVSWSAENIQSCELQTPKISEPVYKLTTSACDTPRCNECFGLQSSATTSVVSVAVIAFAWATQHLTEF